MRVRMSARYSASPRDRSHSNQAVVMVRDCTRFTLTRGRMRVRMSARYSASPRDRSHSNQAVVMVRDCTRSYLD
jgi:hypothetical protein